MDFRDFRKAVDRAAGIVAPAYKAAEMAAVPFVFTAIGIPFLTPVAEAGLSALPAQTVLALGLAPNTAGLSLFLFSPDSLKGA